MRDRRIDELARIEFKGSLGEVLFAYGQEMWALGTRLKFELEMGASDSEAAMASLKGHPLLFGMDARIKARRVAKRLKRASDLADGLANEGRELHRAYARHFLAHAKSNQSKGR